jgi:hypothetical protein
MNSSKLEGCKVNSSSRSYKEQALLVMCRHVPVSQVDEE